MLLRPLRHNAWLEAHFVVLQRKGFIIVALKTEVNSSASLYELDVCKLPLINLYRRFSAWATKGVIEWFGMC